MILSAFFISLAVTGLLILLGLIFSDFNGFAGHVARIEVERARRLFAGFLLVRILIHENSLVCAKATQRELISCLRLSAIAQVPNLRGCKQMSRGWWSVGNSGGERKAYGRRSSVEQTS
jgi:hypothetical protein